MVRLDASYRATHARAQAQQAAQGGYDPKRGAVLYSQLQQEQEQGGSSSSHISSAALTAEGEALPTNFLGACACMCAYYATPACLGI